MREGLETQREVNPRSIPFFPAGRRVSGVFRGRRCGNVGDIGRNPGAAPCGECAVILPCPCIVTTDATEDRPMKPRLFCAALLAALVVQTGVLAAEPEARRK